MNAPLRRITTDETILYLSDQATNSNSVLVALKANGYEVVSTDGATQAIALLYVLHGVAGVLLNHRVREWVKFDIARSFRAIRADVPIVLLRVTGSTACRHAWMLAWIADSRWINSPPRCGVCWP